MPVGSGRLRLEVDGVYRRDRTGYLLGVADLVAHLGGGNAWDLAATLQARGGILNTGDGWRPEVSGTAGLELRWD